MNEQAVYLKRDSSSRLFRVSLFPFSLCMVSVLAWVVYPEYRIYAECAFYVLAFFTLYIFRSIQNIRDAPDYVTNTRFDVFPAIATLPKIDGRVEWIYVIQDIEISGHCKIGRTAHLDNRLNLFNVKLPFRWQLLALIPVADSRKSEIELHLQYADQRINGEWFALSQSDIDNIRKVK